MGDAQGDQGRNGKGAVNMYNTPFVTGASSATGAFVLTGETYNRVASPMTGSGWRDLTLDFSRVAPTGLANAPRRWGALCCAYLGQPAS